MNTIQFYSVEPNAFIKEITETVKTLYYPNLQKPFKRMSQNATYPQMRFANVSESQNPRYTNTENVTFSKVTN